MQHIGDEAHAAIICSCDVKTLSLQKIDEIWTRRQ